MKQDVIEKRLRDSIRRMADEKGIKHCKIAEACGMTSAEFSRMLAGQKVIRACYIPLIASAIGCTCDDLFRGAGAALGNRLFRPCISESLHGHRTVSVSLSKADTSFLPDRADAIIGQVTKNVNRNCRKRQRKVEAA